MDKKELIELEMTEDLEHLPNSIALKSFIRCFAEETQQVEPKANKVLLGKFANLSVDLTREEQEIFLGMAKGCIKRARPIKDLLDYTYEIFICFKQNDNEVN